VFAYFSAYFASPLFFQPLGAVGGTLAAFATIGVGFVIRPVGAILFGHLGDRIGRRSTLLITIAIMGVATGVIGLLPSYARAGYPAIVAFALLVPVVRVDRPERRRATSADEPAQAA